MWTCVVCGWNKYLSRSARLDFALEITDIIAAIFQHFLCQTGNAEMGPVPPTIFCFFSPEKFTLIISTFVCSRLVQWVHPSIGCIFLQRQLLCSSIAPCCHRWSWWILEGNCSITCWTEPSKSFDKAYEWSFLTNRVTVTCWTAQSCHLLVEAVLAALTVPSFSVSLAVDAVEPPGILKAILRPSIAGAMPSGCMWRKHLYLSFFFCWIWRL